MTKLRSLSTATALVTLLASGASAQPVSGGTVVFSLGSDPSALNRNMSSSTPDGLIACTIYEGLVDVTADGEIVPRLAESWTVSDDGLTYTFTLRDANFSDGTPVTSADVKYTFEEISGRFSSVFSGVGNVIESIDTPSESEVVLNLSSPYGPLLRSLNCTQGASILPMHLYEGTDPATNEVTTSAPVGTGPFMLTEWRRGEYLRLERNPDYWEEGLPYLDGLIAQVQPQAASRTQTLLAGEIDYVHFTLLPTNDYGRLEGNPDFKLLPSPVPALNVMLMNNRNEVLAVPEVRKALFMATNRDQLLTNAYGGVGLKGVMPFSQRMPWAADAESDYDTLYPYDPEAAAAMLDEAGFAEGDGGTRFTLTLNYLADDNDGALAATAIKSMWQQIGVEVNIMPGERVSLLPRVFTEFDFDLALAAYNSGGDPAIGLSRIWSSETAGRNFGNPTGYSDPEIDAMFVEAQAATTLEDRGAIYARIQHKLARDLPLLTLHERIQDSGMIARLEGLEDEYYMPTFRDAWLAAE